MLKQTRQVIVQSLWEKYRHTTMDIRLIEEGLAKKGVGQLTLDHFAIIDLPGAETGMQNLSRIFSALGYEYQGQDYLPDKQNDFLWLAEENSVNALAGDALPQAVVADFRLDELPLDVRNIIASYASLAAPSPVKTIEQLAARARNNDEQAANQLCPLVVNYLSGRTWPLPRIREFRTVHEFNELLAWVLIFGHRPNHFTLSVHLLSQFPDLAAFHRFIEDDLLLPLNYEGGVIKGHQQSGIAQGSTAGNPQHVQLADGVIELPMGFVEFVWRYPQSHLRDKPIWWKDYFTGFVANHANRVIESLYIKE